MKVRGDRRPPWAWSRHGETRMHRAIVHLSRSLPRVLENEPCRVKQPEKRFDGLTARRTGDATRRIPLPDDRAEFERHWRSAPRAGRIGVAHPSLGHARHARTRRAGRPARPRGCAIGWRRCWRQTRGGQRSRNLLRAPGVGGGRAARAGSALSDGVSPYTAAPPRLHPRSTSCAGASGSPHMVTLS